MNRLAFWLAAKLSLALEPHERDALHGDHAELGVSGAQALRDVLGLVIRRQLEPWKDWWPWLAVGSGVLPFIAFAEVNIYLAHSFTMTPPAELFSSRGPSYSGWLLTGSVLVLGALASWACGFVISAFSDRARGVNVTLLFFAWLFALTGLASPRYKDTWEEQTFRLVSTLVFHLIWFALPAFTGLWRGRKSPYLTLRGAGTLTCLYGLPVIATLVVVATLDQGRGEIGLNEVLFIALISVAYAWPSGPIILRSLFSRRLVAQPIRALPH